MFIQVPGLAFTQVKKTSHLVASLDPGSFTTVCGCQGRLYMHSGDPVELYWP